MRNRKWLFPLAVVLVALAAALILALSLLFAHNGGLYDYALTLTDKSLFVRGDGSLWELETEGSTAHFLSPAGRTAPVGVERSVSGADETLISWEYGLRLYREELFIRADGSLWRLTVNRNDGRARVVPVLFAEEPMEAAEPKKIAMRIESVNRGFVEALLWLPEEYDGALPEARLAVCLDGSWYAFDKPVPLDQLLGHQEGGANSTYHRFWLPFGRDARQTPGVVPAGRYRVELYREGELLLTRECTVERDGINVRLVTAQLTR